MTVTLFAITSLETLPAPDGFRVRWPSVSNRVYDIQFAIELPIGFSDLETNLAATPPLNVYTHPVDADIPQGFYRVRSRLP